MPAQELLSAVGVNFLFCVNDHRRIAALERYIDNFTGSMENLALDAAQKSATTDLSLLDTSEYIENVDDLFCLMALSHSSDKYGDVSGFFTNLLIYLHNRSLQEDGAADYFNFIMHEFFLGYAWFVAGSLDKRGTGSVLIMDSYSFAI